jgi:hypothetical protein
MMTRKISVSHFYRALFVLFAIPICSFANAVAQSPSRQSQSKGAQVKVEFVRFVSNHEQTYAQYRVTNTGARAVRFVGSGTNANWLIVIKQGALIKQGPSIWGTHQFGAYSLPPGKTIAYDVLVPDNDAAFQIGFAYESGASHAWSIAWSAEIKKPSK